MATPWGKFRNFKIIKINLILLSSIMFSFLLDFTDKWLVDLYVKAYFLKWHLIFKIKILRSPASLSSSRRQFHSRLHDKMEFLRIGIFPLSIWILYYCESYPISCLCASVYNSIHSTWNYWHGKPELLTDTMTRASLMYQSGYYYKLFCLVSRN